MNCIEQKLKSMLKLLAVFSALLIFSSASFSEEMNWKSRFSLEGKERPGPYTKDPHIWIYTKAFAERFGMPDEWISDELKGVEAVAWRKISTGFSICGWAGKNSACNESKSNILELYFDTRKINIPWAPWSRESDQLDISLVNSQHFLSPRDCELRRENSISPVGYRGKQCVQRIHRQPLADPETKNEIFMFSKGETYRKQGNFTRVEAYDKQVYPSLSWLQVGFFPQSVNMGSRNDNLIISFETRDAPLGKTLHLFHEITLPNEYIIKLKNHIKSERKKSRSFYKKSLEIN